MSSKTPFTAEMDTSDIEDTQIWRLKGKMMTGSCCYDFLDSVRENIASGRNHPVIDLTGITWVNSTGVGVLASIFNAARDAGGAMHLVKPNERVQAILKVVNLWPVVSVFDSVAEALEHLKAR